MGKKRKRKTTPKPKGKSKAALPVQVPTLDLPPELLRFIDDPTEPFDEKVRLALDKILESERVRANLFLLAIVRKRIRRLLSVFQELDKVSDSIMGDLEDKAMPPEDKIKFLQALQDEVDKAAKFIESMSSRETLSVILQSIEEHVGGTTQTKRAELKLPSSFMSLPPAKRERVRQVALELLGKSDVEED